MSVGEKQARLFNVAEKYVGEINRLEADRDHWRQRAIELEAELTQLRKQSAHEHEVWEALRIGAVDRVGACAWRDGKPTRFSAEVFPGEVGRIYKSADDPVGAVRAAVEAMKPETEVGGDCHHPWHRNPGLITQCPECTKQGPTT